MASPPPSYYPLAATSQKEGNATGPNNSLPPPPYPGQQPPMALPYTQQASAPTLQYHPQQQQPPYPQQQQQPMPQGYPPYNAPPMQPQPGLYNPQYPQPPSVQAYAVPIPTSQQGVWLDGQACFIPPLPGHYLQIERATFGSIDVTRQTQMLVQRQGGCSLSIAGGDSHNFVQHFGDPQPNVQKRFMLAYIMRPMVIILQYNSSLGSILTIPISKSNHCTYNSLLLYFFSLIFDSHSLFSSSLPLVLRVRAGPCLNWLNPPKPLFLLDPSHASLPQLSRSFPYVDQ